MERLVRRREHRCCCCCWFVQSIHPATDNKRSKATARPGRMIYTTRYVARVCLTFPFVSCLFFQIVSSIQLLVRRNNLPYEFDVRFMEFWLSEWFRKQLYISVIWYRYWFRWEDNCIDHWKHDVLYEINISRENNYKKIIANFFYRFL